ncbi:MAG: sulfatase [Akkermansiaceae bacterium]
MKLKSIIALFLSAATATSQAQETSSTSTKPNILLICIDDLRPELPSFGKDYIHAPNIEKLFSQGRLFKRHYVQAPTCGSSRFAMLTGLYPDGPGELSNSCIPAHDHETRPTFPAHLRNNGYYTAAVGKVSHYPGNLTGKNWADQTKPEIPNAWDICLQSNGEWKHAQALMHGYADGVAREKGKSPVIEAKDARYPDDATMDGFKTQLETVTTQDKPWLLAVGLLRPHLPFACNIKYLDIYQGVTLPAIPANQRPPKGDFWHPSGEMTQYLQAADPREDATHADNVRRHYAACVSSSDEHVGTILELLAKYDVDKNTIVILWGDHGWHLGEQKIWGKHSPYAVALHSPLFIKLPSTNSPGTPSNEVVETLDLYPTLCDLINIKKPAHLEGHSLANILQDPTAKSDGTAISYWKNLKSTITTDEHKINQWTKGKTGSLKQHYNLKSDPFETTNLVDKK